MQQQTLGAQGVGVEDVALLVGADVHALQKTYVLWLNIYDIVTTGCYTGLQEANPANSPMALRVPRQASGEVLYTCHPEGGMDIVDVKAAGEGTNGEWSFPFGPYQLIIKDGKKYLQVDR